MNQKQFLSAPLRKWLADNEGGVKRLMAAGLTESSIEKIRLNRCSDRFFLMYGPAIEKVTGISAGKLLIKTAKHELWGNNDKLSQIVSSEELVAEFRAAAETNPYDAGRIVRTEGPKNLNDFIAEHRKWGIVRIKNVLSAIAQLGQTAAPESKDFKFVTKDDEKVSLGESKKILYSAGPIISLLNSTMSVAEAFSLPHDGLSDSEVVNVSRAIFRILKALGITEKRIRGLVRGDGSSRSDRETLFAVIRAFSTKQ